MKIVAFSLLLALAVGVAMFWILVHHRDRPYPLIPPATLLPDFRVKNSMGNSEIEKKSKTVSAYSDRGDGVMGTIQLWGKGPVTDDDDMMEKTYLSIVVMAAPKISVAREMFEYESKDQQKSSIWNSIDDSEVMANSDQYVMSRSSAFWNGIAGRRSVVVGARYGNYMFRIVGKIENGEFKSEDDFFNRLKIIDAHVAQALNNSMVGN